MINYLSRRATPLATYRFFGGTLVEGREDRVVEQMKTNPPDFIILLTRDLREYGIARFGQNDEAGRAILQWIADDYRLADHAGGDPLDPKQAGLAIYRPKLRSAD